MSPLLYLFAAITFIQDGPHRSNYDLPTQATATFSIINAGIEVAGTIDILEATLSINMQEPSKSYIHATADVASISTGIEIRDKHLLRSDFFDVKKFPLIQLHSRSFKKISKNMLVGEFDLTIKGITRPVTVHIKLSRLKGLSKYSGSFTINRLDFNLGEQSMLLNENVKVELKAQNVDNNHKTYSIRRK
jgi:polyisoprenoid-binding protein YceI